MGYKVVWNVIQTPIIWRGACLHNCFHTPKNYPLKGKLQITFSCSLSPVLFSSSPPLPLSLSQTQTRQNDTHPIRNVLSDFRQVMSRSLLGYQVFRSSEDREVSSWGRIQWQMFRSLLCELSTLTRQFTGTFRGHIEAWRYIKMPQSPCFTPIFFTCVVRL